VGRGTSYEHASPLLGAWPYSHEEKLQIFFSIDKDIWYSPIIFTSCWRLSCICWRRSSAVLDLQLKLHSSVNLSKHYGGTSNPCPAICWHSCQRDCLFLCFKNIFSKI
jgi:hypothetical protein